jgi:hypothetical protein
MPNIFYALLALTILIAVRVAWWIVQEIKRHPVASASPSDIGGSRAGFDILPCVTSSLALASPLARTHAPPSAPDPLGAVLATGRGLNKDYYCADDVAITITDKEIWLEVDKDNLTRVKRIKRLVVDDRRTA